MKLERYREGMEPSCKDDAHKSINSPKKIHVTEDDP